VATIKVGTYNVENLFLRYRFEGEERVTDEPSTWEDCDERGNILMLGVSIDDCGPIGWASRELTGRVIDENEAE